VCADKISFLLFANGFQLGASSVPQSVNFVLTVCESYLATFRAYFQTFIGAIATYDYVHSVSDTDAILCGQLFSSCAGPALL